MRDRVWSWPIASYLFLGGLGGSLAIITAISDLVFHVGNLFVASIVGSVVALGLGCLFLVFELGRPLQAWRAFSTQHAVLTFGTWSLTFLLISDVILFSFWSGWFPWSGAEAGRLVFTVLVLVLGCCVLVYTGIELSSMRGRTFWNTPALPFMFVLSGILNGSGAAYLLIGVWPVDAFEQSMAVVRETMRDICLLLAVAVLICLLIYVVIMRTAQGDVAKQAAKRWLTGQYAVAFWGGLVICCLIVPIVLLAFDTPVGNFVAAFLLIVSGVLIRFLFLFSDDRRVVNGFGDYVKRLPTGDETFLKKNW